MPPGGSARRSARSGRPRSATRRAASTSCSSTASRTLRVMAQAVSSVKDSGRQPALGVSDCVFLKPTSPCSAAGTRIEPRVSEPSAAQAAPAATVTAPPEVEPPGMRGVASSASVPALAGVPWCGLMPMPEKANSVRLVWPISAAPAARSRATAGLSAVAGAASAIDFEAAVLGMPATSNRSLTDTASPASGGTGAPAQRCASTAAAVARAMASKRRTKAWRHAGASAAAMRALDVLGGARAARLPLRRLRPRRSSAGPRARIRRVC